MNRRSSFLRRTEGFSLTGTLVAVAIGGIVAALTATLISEAVRGQRNIVDRDEMSEFTLFVKNVLNTDSTCTAILNQKPFPVGTTADLELAIGYGDQPAAVIRKGFTFANGMLEVEEFTIEDRSPSTVQFRIGVSDGAGNTTEQVVRRHLARVKLTVKNANTGAGYRSRYFEFPLLMNTATNAIEMCNNEVNIGDACQAMGFRWDATVTPPQCVMTNTCLYGGAYTSRRNGTCGAADQNPATAACSCPAGYTQVTAGSVNITNVCVKGCDRLNYDTVVQCFLCPN